MASIFHRGISVARTRVRRWRQRRQLTPGLGAVDFGDLRRTVKAAS